MKKFFIICYLTALLSISATAQEGYLKLTIEDSFKPIVSMFDTLRGSVSMRYLCNYNYNIDNYIYFKVKVNNQPIFDFHPFQQPEIFMTPGMEINNIPVQIQVNPAIFTEGGGHTVVIWPVISGNTPIPVLPLDSVEIGTGVLVNGYFSLDKNKPNNNKVSYFPVPFQNQLSVENNTNTTIERIRIINISGKTLVDTTNPKDPIETNSITPGIYFIETYFSDQTMIKHKIIKH